MTKSRSFQNRIARLVCLSAVAVSAQAQLNENCTVSVLNRNTRVNANGNWRIDNIPALNSARAIATCTNNGITQPGESGLVAILPNIVNAFDSTVLLATAMPLGGSGAIQPIPASL